MCTLQSCTIKDLYAECGHGLVLRSTHCPQLSDWDCGRACLVMSCSDSKMAENVKLEVERNYTRNVALWTIDIAFVCKLVGLKHQMYTTTLGATPAYKDEPFYLDQGNIDNDIVRINQMFRDATDLGINVTKRSLQLEDILLHIANHKKPVVVLVDCSQLLATPDADEVAKGLERLQLIDSDDGVSPTEDHQNTGGSTRARPAYQGHYILLLGFDLTNKRVFFHDPSPSGRYNNCSFEDFDRARKSFGTDEDLLFVFPP